MMDSPNKPPSDPHFIGLQNMYLAAPINEFYRPMITVGEGVAEIGIELTEAFHHSGGSVHGSVYFKMLDDAAFFAANSLERESFVLTSSFTTYLLRPLVLGPIRSEGTVVHRTRSQFIAEAVVYDAEGREAGRGNGVFVRSKKALTSALGYAD